MENKIALRPSYWASVSGGKDSLYMLKVIFSNPDKYPLDGVVHFELDIDFPFVKNVVDYMESECKKFGIPFYRIKPRENWVYLYENYGFPTRQVRWCNNKYKLDACCQLEEFLKSQGYYTVHYIGYCVDETKRYYNRKAAGITEIYPLVQEGIEEDTILEWARNQKIFNNFYKTNRRCGCMLCPMASRISLAYTYKYYPKAFHDLIMLMSITEQDIERKTGKPFAIMDGNPKYNAEYIERIVKTKWIKILEEREREYDVKGSR